MLKNNLNKNEKGFASIVIALVFIIVISLLTVAFAQLARREQQGTLDKQLASQAFYAAETAVNDVRKYIKSGQITDQGATPTPGINTNQCLGAPLTTGGSNVLDINNDVSYTCVIVNLQPSSLEKDLDSASPDNTWTTMFSTDQPLRSINVNWYSTSPGAKTPRSSLTAGNTPDNGVSWNSPAVLQMSITPLTSLDRASLISSSFNAYLYPARPGVASYPRFTGEAPIIGECTVAAVCNSEVTALPGGTGPFLLRIVGYYDKSHITVTGKTAFNVPVKFINAQAKIDATGRARNVLKRVKVSDPIVNTLELPSFAIEAQNICKRFYTLPGATIYDSTPAINDPSCVLGPN